MKRLGERRSPSESGSRGMSPQIGFILLLGLVIVGAALVYVIGIGSIQSTESQVYAEQTERDLRQFDSELESLRWQDDTQRTVTIGDDLETELVSDGELVLTASDGYVNSSSEPIDLQALVATDRGGNEFAYQAGGIWRLDGDRATSVTPPAVDYYTEDDDGEPAGRIDIAPLTLEGQVDSGEHTVRGSESNDVDVGENLDYVSHVTIELSGSAYHDGWYEFLKEEFDATDASELPDRDCDVSGQIEENVICHDESAETVTVVATVDGETAFENLVAIEPTIHGGLYLEGTEGRFDSSLSVASYDGHDADTANGTDLFVANYDRFEFGNDTDLDGMPVVNGDLASDGDPSISQIAYGEAIDEDSNVRLINESETVYALDANNETFATELASSYEGADPIDGEIDRLLAKYLVDGPTASGDVTAGLYDGVSGIDSLDSSAGDIHVAAEDGLALSDVTVAGDNRTNVYVDGDVDLSNVEVASSDRADSLWVYATSDSTISVDGDFQGVVYAPGADLEIDDGVTIDGAVVAGDATEIGDDVRVNFDASLRSATPLSEEDEDLSFEYGSTRKPLDMTIILDRSGSMGPHNPNGWYAYEPEYEIEIGEAWEPIPTDEPFRNTQTDSPWSDERDIEIRNQNGSTRTLEPEEFAHPDDWTEIRVHPRDRAPGNSRNNENTATIGIYDHPGNDPTRQRVEATRNVIGELDADVGDRVGVYDFARDGRVLHPLSDDLETARRSVEGTAHGGTNMAAGLELALAEYEERGTDDRERIAILLSDGENNRDEDDEAMDELVDEAREQNVTLHTVGLDGLEHASIPEEKLERWANETGGNFYKTADPEELLDHFEQIAEEEFDTEMATRMAVSVTHDREVTGDHAVRLTERRVEIDD